MFAREGARVLCVNRDPAVDAAAAAIAEAGGQAAARVADLASPDQARAATEDARERFGRIDVVHACAGIAGAGTAADTDLEAWDRSR